MVSRWECEIGLPFKPTRKFYETVGINQKRYAMLLRGEKDMYVFEAVRLAKFFKQATTFLVVEYSVEEQQNEPTNKAD